MDTIGIIPARFASSRFPGKVIADLLGRPMIQWVWEAAKKSRLLEDLIVALDDERVLEAVDGFGGKAVLTSKDHRSGTDRISEVASGLDAAVVINIQADEPMLSPSMIDDLAAVMLDNPCIQMATLVHPIDDTTELNDPNVVKVTFDRDGFAKRFSRARISHSHGEIGPFKHIGMYAYRKAFLLEFTKMPSTASEKAESLEQLRALDNGVKMKVIETKHNPIGVDTQADLEKVKEALSRI